MGPEPTRLEHLDPVQLTRQIETLRCEVLQREISARGRLDTLSPERRESARNLLHYIALREHDLQSIQAQLSGLGLASLYDAEPAVLAAIDSVLNRLYLISAVDPPAQKSPSDSEPPVDHLALNTIRLFGPPPPNRRARIMVTLPAAAATDYMMLHQLLKNGMNCVRINCAHEDQAAWRRMIGYLRDAERATGKTCRILMDLPGPKLRTGPMELMPAVLRIKPVRDAFGNVVRPARIWLTSNSALSSESCTADGCIQVDQDWLADCKVRDQILLRDARGSKRKWRVREVSAEGCWAECGKTTYLVNGTVLRLRGLGHETTVQELPRSESVVHLRCGEQVLLCNSQGTGQPELRSDEGALLSPGRIALPIEQVYRTTRPGEPVCFDDGRITGIIESKEPDQLRVRITHTRREQEKLASGKGINFPDSRLDLAALSEKDSAHLEFAVQHADLIGLSFTNSAQDVQMLHSRIQQLGCEEPGVIFKIETKWGLAALPEILFEALRFRACGIMIARGDLAVECGFEQMAEIQEDMLWTCQAAHVPVIWATQVLDNLSRCGHPTRAEITDAATSQLAECVMLNKGAYTRQAVQALDEILQRMQHHRAKKRGLLRRLNFDPASYS